MARDSLPRRLRWPHSPSTPYLAAGSATQYVLPLRAALLPRLTLTAFFSPLPLSLRACYSARITVTPSCHRAQAAL